MHSDNLEATAHALVADGKGILAADETSGTLTRRHEQLKILLSGEVARGHRSNREDD